MRTIRHIIRKEFLQIVRNRMMIPFITVMPVVQLILLSYAATFEVKHVKVGVNDQDQSEASALLLQKFSGSGYFKINETAFSTDVLLAGMQADEVDMVLTIPKDFEKDLTNGLVANVQLLINGVNSQKAGLANAYSQGVLAGFNKEWAAQHYGQVPELNPKIEKSYWYNPELDYKLFMVPGILAVLITIVTAFLTGINVVREKEIGTIEQLNVSPIKKYQFFIGKLFPFWVIGLFLLSLGLFIGYLFFGITTQGSLALLFGFVALYLLAILGFGLLISTLAETQQQSMFLTWFFAVIFILMSGIFTPVDSMPEWAKVLNTINPLKYLVEVMRQVMLKGSEFGDIAHYFLIMVGFAFGFNALAVWRYRKTV
ncbi:MAG TPA: ABC transporter permease [Cryomorphaceae bacterium]|nr:ABC transporter permease [Owenweeksia sp.]HAD96503.1 ABC transporter permease [Cryomorphaceae bacterium]HBF20259.1 ABC transporter permease [Cryomorphaceae bacterium]HCQ16139.1 ABC transporter permease [Cryomorphaceae bacterium]|tara:strand:- start:142 stop:1251 length:1110 start_codon:yes stop_codon:yes gene_type:complete